MPTFPTPEPVSVSVRLGVGSLRVTASDRTDTAVEVRPAGGGNADLRAAEDTTVEYLDGTVTVRVPKRFSLFGSGGAVDITVGVPAGSRLDANTSMAELSAAGPLGAVRFRSGYGEASVRRCGGALDLRTGFGDVTVGDVDGDATVGTGSGELRVGHVAGNAVLTNSNGPVHVASVGGDLSATTSHQAITAGSVDGDVTARTAHGRIAVERAGGSVSLETAHGNLRVGGLRTGTATLTTPHGRIDVGIAPGVAAWIDAHSRDGGAVRTELDETGPPADGTGTVEVRARTGFGHITIHRSPEEMS